MAKKLNRRFLIVLTLVIAGGMAAAVAVPFVLIRRDAGPALENARVAEQKAMAAAGEELEFLRQYAAALVRQDEASDPAEVQAARDQAAAALAGRAVAMEAQRNSWRDAHDNYQRALARDQRNVQLLLKLANVRNELLRFGFDFNDFRKLLQTWEIALELDPRCVPALNSLLDTYLDLVEMEPAAHYYTQLRLRGAALALADPTDIRARACAQIGVLGAWLHGTAVPAEDVQQALAALEQLLVEKSDQWLIPWYVAMVHSRLASERQSNDPEAAAAHLARAEKAFQDAYESQGVTPGLVVREIRVVQDIRRQRHMARVEAMEPEEQVIRAIVERLEQASAPAHQQDRLYVEARLLQADLLGRLGESAEAERLLLDLIRARPYDLRVAEAAARSPGMHTQSRQQPLDLLQRAVVDEPSFKGIRSRLRAQHDYLRLTQLVQVRLRHYLQAQPSERAGLGHLIEQDLSRAEAMVEGENPLLMKLRAQYLLLDPRGQNRVDAIRLMQRALDIPRSPLANDIELMTMLARNYRTAGQSGEARTLLSRVVAARPGSPYLRIQLADLLLSERLFDQARPHVEQLQAQFKDVPIEDAMQRDLKEQAATLQIRLLMSTGRRQEAITHIHALLEVTPAHRLFKARLFMAASELEAAEALLAPISREELADGRGEFPATQDLLRVFLRSDRAEPARALVASALEKNPRSTTWKIMKLSVEGEATAEQLQEVRVAMLEQIKDPVSHVLQTVQFKLEERQRDEAIKLLLEAEKRHPELPILGAIFNLACDMSDWGLAEQYVRKLADLDADRAGGAYYRAMLKLRRGDSQSALADAQELTRRVGEFGRNWALLGRAQQAQRRFEEAILSYSKAIEKELDNFEALSGLVQCHAELGQIPMARRFVEQGMRYQQAAVFAELGRWIEESHGDPLAVTADREKAAQERPQVPAVAMALVHNYQRAATSLRARREFERADQYSARAWTALQAASEKWPADLGIAERLDLVAFQVGKAEEGRKAIDRLAAEDAWKDRPEPLLLLARHHQRLAAEARDPQRPQPELAKQALAIAEQLIKQAIEKAADPVPVQMFLARFHLQTQQVDQAVGVLRRLWDQTQSAEIRRELISVLVEAGRHSDAEQMIRKVVAEKSDDTYMLSLLAFVQLKQDKFEEAMLLLTQILKVEPNNASAMYYRGMMRLGTGDAEAALADLVAARNFNPSDPDMRAGLADIYRRRGQIREAVDELEQALQSSPLRRDLRLRLLELHMSEQRWLAAERLLNETRDNPDLAADPIWPQREGQMWLVRGDLPRALESARTAMRLNPQDTQAQYLYLDVLLRASQFEDVVRLTAGASRLPSPQVAWQVHLARAVSLKAGKDDAGAAASFDAALSSIDARNDDAGVESVVRGMLDAMGPQWAINRLTARIHPRWAIQLVQVYLAGNDRKKAAESADRLMAELEKLPYLLKLSALQSAGTAYTAAATSVPGAGDKAIKAYVDYLELLERQRADLVLRLSALNNLACLLAEHPEKPNPAQALNYSRKAYEIMRQANIASPDILDTHGWILVLCQRLDEGIAVLLQAAASERAPPDTFYHLGEAYLQKKLYELAETNLTRAMEVFRQRQAARTLVDPALEGRIQDAVTRLGRARAAEATGATVP
jgi:tetratricopeptide (TPR) repeat protein